MDLCNVIVSDLAELDLDIFLDFLINVKLSRQSAESVYQDYVETLGMLKLVAGSLKLSFRCCFIIHNENSWSRRTS